MKYTILIFQIIRNNSISLTYVKEISFRNKNVNDGKKWLYLYCSCNKRKKKCYMVHDKTVTCSFQNFEKQINYKEIESLSKILLHRSLNRPDA